MSFRLASPRRRSSLSISSSAGFQMDESARESVLGSLSNPVVEEETAKPGRVDPLIQTLHNAKSDIQPDDDREKIWGMPNWAPSLEKEIAPGIKVVSVTQMKALIKHYHDLETPTSTLFPWLHGIGDGPLGPKGPLEQFFGYPQLDPPRYRGLCLVRAPYQPERENGADGEGQSPTESTDSGDPTDHDRRTSMPSIQSDWSRRRDTTSSQLSSPSTEVSTAQSTWDASSGGYSWSTAATTPPTRTGSLASHTGDGFPGLKAEKADQAAQREAERIPEGMHPTCVKLPSVKPPGRHTVEAGSTIAQAEAVQIESDASSPTPMDTSPVGQSHMADNTPPSHNHRSVSTAETPVSPVSPLPSDTASALRTYSGRGRNRGGDGKVSLLPPTSVPKTPEMGNLTIPDDDETENDTPIEDEDLVPVASDPTDPNPPPLENESCMLLNALKAEAILDLTTGEAQKEDGHASFMSPDIGLQISLRNLKIQTVKYATISDLIIYAPHGLQRDSRGKSHLLEVAKKFCRAQEKCYQQRLELFYKETGPDQVNDDIKPTHELPKGSLLTPDQPLPRSAMSEEGTTFGDVLMQVEQRDKWQREHRERLPIKYNVVIVTNKFEEIQKMAPQLVETTSNGMIRPERNLFHREAEESTKLAGASMIADGVWLGNWRDDPCRRQDRASSWLKPSLVIEAHDFADMPEENLCNTVYRNLSNGNSAELQSTNPRPGNQSPSHIYLEVGSSSRSGACHVHSHAVLAKRLLALVECVTKVVGLKKRDGKGSPTVLVLCEDGYTETSLFALAYLMYSRGISLEEAYLVLHLELHRSFFVYPFDVAFLQVVEKQVLEKRSQQTSPKRSMRSSSPIAKWNPFGANGPQKYLSSEMRDIRREGGHKAAYRNRPNDDTTTWMGHNKFDGSLPSRVTDHLYLGNFGHAVNGDMLRALGITHVVSVGETLSQEPCVIHGHYVHASNLSGNHGHSKKNMEGAITIFDIQNVKDDGQDNLQPQFTAASTFIEDARTKGGKVLVHCRVGVSRSATIVIAYLMAHDDMSLMDAYLMTRASRLNVLIQPSLLFLREALHLESDLCRKRGKPLHFKNRWTWPALCRDIWDLNKRYLQPA